MKNLKKDSLLFAFIVFTYFIGRLALLILFNSNGDIPTLEWYFTSLRFDIMTAAYFVLPTFVLSVIGLFLGLSFAKIKSCYAIFALFVSIILAIVNVCFFYEYKSQFNYWIFGIFFDDFRAIVAFIWKAYPVVWILIGWLVALFLLSKAVFALFRKIDSREASDISLVWKIVVTLLAIFALVVCARGVKISGRPLQLRDIAVSPSEFLNNLIPSSAYCIKSEMEKFFASMFADGLKLFKAKKRDVPHFVNEVFGGKSGDLSVALKRTARGTPLKKTPSRIFFIVGEGHSAWPTYERFTNLNIMPNTREFYKTSLFCKQALASGGGTMATISSLISGIPFTGVDVRGIFMHNTDCSIAVTLERLGYSSTFFYAGQSSWLQLGDFARFNGFDNVEGGEEMGDLFGSVEWGIRDKDMFNFILSRDIPEKSFNMILTVSNHPPFDVDLRAEGCSADLKTKDDVKMYHMWYADKEIGRFAHEIFKKYPDSLIVVTGDHAARTFPDSIKMSTAEVSCVPIIFMGKALEDAGLAGKEVLEAQHLDIIPTLVELLAPKGFEYKAWGAPLVGDAPRERIPMTPFLCMLSGEVIPLNSAKCPISIREFARKYFALSYYMSMMDNTSVKKQN